MATNEAELEQRHRSCCEAAAKARIEYENLYGEMAAQLSQSHLQPFIKVLLQSEKHLLQNEQELVDELKQKMLNSLQTTLDHFWQENDVTNRVATLLILKDQFKEFQGTNWDIQKKNPHQRTLPLRMRFKETRVRHLQKQLEFQATELEDIMKENQLNRTRVRSIQHQRTRIRENMARIVEYMTHERQKMMDMTAEVLNCHEGNAFDALDASQKE